MLLQLTLVSVSAGTDGANERLLASVDAHVGDVALPTEEALSAGFASEERGRI